MPRLYRPSIPVEIKCRVVLRQLGGLFIDDVIKQNRPKPDASYMMGIVGIRTGRSLGRLLKEKLAEFAETLNCNVSDLRLDHDPPLGARPQERRGLGKKTYYFPDANDPEHLFYRPHGTQFEGSHDTKTRIRGDHGQFSDIALIKRERRRNRKKNTEKLGKRKPKSAVRKKFRWAKRKFATRRKP